MSDGFTSAGREKFPNCYLDYQQVGAYATWPQTALERVHGEYTDFLERDDLMPRAISTASLILLHCGFELAYREGIYGETAN